MLIGATFATSVFNYIYSLFTIRYIYFKMLRNPQNGCKTARFVGDRKTCCKMLHKVVKEKSVPFSYKHSGSENKNSRVSPDRRLPVKKMLN